MKKYSKEELLERAAPFFKEGKTLMIGTSDGNLWQEEHRHLAINHSRPKGIEIFELTPDGAEKETIIPRVLTEDEQVIFADPDKKTRTAKKRSY